MTTLCRLFSQPALTLTRKMEQQHQQKKKKRGGSRAAT
jgi:hypothetical protein